MSVYRKQGELPVVPEDPTPNFSPRPGRVVFALGVLGLLGAGALAFSRHRAHARDLEALRDHAQIIQHCLLRSDIPGRPGAPLEERLREVQLASIAEYWPSTCGEQLSPLRDEARAAGFTLPALASLEIAQRELSATPLRRNFEPAVQHTLAALDALADTALPRLEPGPGPATANVDTLGDAARLYPGVGKIAFERHAGPEHAILVQPAGGDTRDLCNVQAAGLSCRSIAAAARTPAELAGTRAAGQPPLIFDARLPGTRHGAAGTDRDLVTTAEGREISREIIASGATVTADGTSYVLGPRVMHAYHDFSVPSVELFLGTRTATGPLERKLLDYERLRTNDATVLWDRLFARVAVDEETAVISRPLASGAFTEVLRDGFAAIDAPLEGCRTPRTSVLRSAGHVAFWKDGGALEKALPVPSTGRLFCHDEQAGIVQLEGDPTATGIVHARCTHESCTQTRIDRNVFCPPIFQREPLQREDVRAVELGGRLLLVWHSEQADGLLLMRLAEPDQIAATPDRVVFDDHWIRGHFSNESSLVSFEVEPMGDFALVVLVTTRGAHALRIDAQGNTTQLPVRHP